MASESVSPAGAGHVGLEQPRVGDHRAVVAEGVVAHARTGGCSHGVSPPSVARRTWTLKMRPSQLAGALQLAGGVGGLGKADQRRARCRRRARRPPCPSRSRGARTGGSSGSPRAAARGRSTRARPHAAEDSAHAAKSKPRRGGRRLALRALVWHGIDTGRKGCRSRGGSGGRGRASCARWSGREGEGAATAPSAGRRSSRGCATRACGWSSPRWPRGTTSPPTSARACRGTTSRSARPRPGPRCSRSCWRSCARELRAAGAAAVHGNRHTDFVAAVCAAHAYEARGISPELSLERAQAAGLMVTPWACALLGVDYEEVQPRSRIAASTSAGRSVTT